jgi:hypothetical protein
MFANLLRLRAQLSRPFDLPRIESNEAHSNDRFHTQARPKSTRQLRTVAHIVSRFKGCAEHFEWDSRVHRRQLLLLVHVPAVFKGRSQREEKEHKIHEAGLL